MTEGRRYQIRHAVGRGSFGTVYRAQMLGEGGFSKEVALKILNPDLQESEEVASRLRDEAKLLGLIRHRAILQVDGLVKLEGRWAVVMEFVDGTNLHRIIRAEPVPAGPGLELMGEIAAALHVAYNQAGPEGGPLHLIHRDIKPANIQITVAGEVKVLDFGIARADFETRETETVEMLLGSMGYMAPERLDCIDGPAGDIYALGATFYEMLTGSRLGKTSASQARHDAHIQIAMHRLRGILGHDAEQVVHLVERTLAYEPEHRPSSKELEYACRGLRQTIGGPWLAEWAERTIPPIVEAQRRGLAEDILCGVTLHEMSSSAATLWNEVDAGERARRNKRGKAPVGTGESGVQSTAITAARRALPYLGVGAGAMTLVIALPLALAVVVLAVVLAVGVASEDDTVVPMIEDDAGPSATATAADTGDLDVKPLFSKDAYGAPVVDARPEPAKPEAPVRATRPVKAASTSAPRPARPDASVPPKAPPAADPPETEAIAAPTGTILPTGDVLVRLVAVDGSEHRTGAVPPGRYDIYATFPGRVEGKAGQVDVAVGQVVKLTCNATFHRCTPR